MSRDIKFRVWDKDVCAYIDRKRTFDFTSYLRLNFDEGNGVAIDSLCPGRYIYEQYTGLKDKNGKEIHEGDIISVTQGYKPDTWEERGIVVWDDEYARFDAGECIADGGWEAIFPNWRGEIDGIKVIGNIHENPELLGGEE